MIKRNIACYDPDFLRQYFTYDGNGRLLHAIDRRGICRGISYIITAAGSFADTAISTGGYRQAVLPGILNSGRMIRLNVHRVIFSIYNNQNPGELDVDHYPDRNRLNNHHLNLRLASRRLGNINRYTCDDKFIGVSFDFINNKFRATIVMSGKQKYIGRFSTNIEAARAYDAAVLLHLGPDAPTNASLGRYKTVPVETGISYQAKLNAVG